MSDTQQLSPPNPTPPPDLLLKDWFLISLIDLVQRNGIGIGVTLNVSGQIISGTISNGAEYFEEFGKQFISGFPNPEEMVDTAKSFADLGEIYKDPPEIAKSNPTYIHLKEAKFFVPGQRPIPTNKGVWWRGRLMAIDGFSLGTLSYD